MRRRLSTSRADSLQPHDHVVWYGDGADDLYALASVALAGGERLREKLLFVAEGPDPGRLRELDGLERLLDSGQLEMLDVGSVYGTGLSFSHTRQLATFETVLANALIDGYTGIRVVADNTSLVRGDADGFQRWLCWEQLTDRFQARSNVTGICFFDRSALSEQRQSDLASLHPVRSATSVTPPFSFTVDGDAVLVTGMLDAFSADQFRRMLATAPDDRPLIVDLSSAEFVDHHAMLALGGAASAVRPVHLRGARPIMRQLQSLLEIRTPYLRFAQ